MAQAGILSCIMSMRAEVCGYTSAQISAFAVSQVKVAKDEVERFIPTINWTTDVMRCWSQRLDFAIRRLGESTDPLVMGFLTMDTCVPSMRIPQVVVRDPVTIAVSKPLNYLDPGMVDVGYPAREDYQTGNFTRGAWLIAPPNDAAYASAWFHFMKGYENLKGTWDLFSIQNKFKLSLQRDFGRDKLILSGACGGDEVSHVDLTYRPGWRFVSVAIRGKIAIIRYDSSTWQVTAPSRADCRESAASLGPRLDAPWDGRQAENAIIRFYDFKVSADPHTQEDLFITRNHLDELGTDTPIVCNPRNGNERRDGLNACYPGPVVRIQYFYDNQPEEVAAPVEVVSADVTDNVPVHVEKMSHSVTKAENIEFGQREYLLCTGLGLTASLLIACVFVWYLQRSFARQLELIRKQAQEIRNMVDASDATLRSGSPVQASASGGLGV